MKSMCRGIEGGGGGAEVGGGVEGGGGSIEVGGGVKGGSVEIGGGIEGGGAEVGQRDGVKSNFTMVRVSHRRGYSPYTRYIFSID
jgi:hypothetical protein